MKIMLPTIPLIRPMTSPVVRNNTGSASAYLHELPILFVLVVILSFGDGAGWRGMEKHMPNYIKPHRYMYFRKQLMREWETNCMKCALYTFEGSVPVVRTDLEGYSFGPIEMYEIEGPNDFPATEYVQRRYNMTVTNYAEHDIHLLCTRRAQLKIERCKFPDQKVPDLIVVIVHDRKHPNRTASFVFMRASPEAPLLLMNIVIFKPELLHARLEALNFRRRRFSYEKLVKNVDHFERLALVRIPSWGTAVHLPWHKEIPFGGTTGALYNIADTRPTVESGDSPKKITVDDFVWNRPNTPYKLDTPHIPAQDAWMAEDAAAELAEKKARKKAPYSDLLDSDEIVAELKRKPETGEFFNRTRAVMRVIMWLYREEKNWRRTGDFSRVKFDEDFKHKDIIETANYIIEQRKIQSEIRNNISRMVESRLDELSKQKYPRNNKADNVENIIALELKRISIYEKVMERFKIWLMLLSECEKIVDDRESGTAAHSEDEAKGPDTPELGAEVLVGDTHEENEPDLSMFSGLSDERLQIMKWLLATEKKLASGRKLTYNDFDYSLDVDLAENTISVVETLLDKRRLARVVEKERSREILNELSDPSRASGVIDNEIEAHRENELILEKEHEELEEKAVIWTDLLRALVKELRSKEATAKAANQPAEMKTPCALWEEVAADQNYDLSAWVMSMHESNEWGRIFCWARRLESEVKNIPEEEYDYSFSVKDVMAAIDWIEGLIGRETKDWRRSITDYMNEQFDKGVETNNREEIEHANMLLSRCNNAVDRFETKMVVWLKLLGALKNVLGDKPKSYISSQPDGRLNYQQLWERVAADRNYDLAELMFTFYESTNKKHFFDWIRRSKEKWGSLDNIPQEAFFDCGLNVNDALELTGFINDFKRDIRRWHKSMINFFSDQLIKHTTENKVVRIENANSSLQRCASVVDIFETRINVWLVFLSALEKALKRSDLESVKPQATDAK